MCGFGNNTQEIHKRKTSFSQEIEGNDLLENNIEESIESYNAVKNRYYQCIDYINETNKDRSILNGDTLADYDLFYSLNYIAAMGLSSSYNSTKLTDMYSALTGSIEFFGLPELQYDQIEDLLKDYFSYHSLDPDKEVLRKMIKKYCSINCITYIIDETVEYSVANGKITTSPIPLYIFEVKEVNVFLDELKLSEQNFAEDILMLNLFGEHVEFNDETHSIIFSIPFFSQ